MDGRDTTRGETPQRAEPHQLTEYVERALDAAVELELESVADGFWPRDDEERDKRKDSIVEAVRLRDRWKAGNQTTADIARLANRAAEEQLPQDWPMPPFSWPTTVEEADDFVTLTDDLAMRATVARDLLVVRDAALAVDCPRSTG